MNMDENDSERADLEEKVKNVLIGRNLPLHDENYTTYYNSAYKQMNEEFDVGKMPEYDKILAIVALIEIKSLLIGTPAYNYIAQRYGLKGDASSLNGSL